ncbi:hypothetical protein [Pedobacter sp. MW01-1-1]|uniref:hypothetical protein n=1 Tax=Pedobacter sp. MW01-1-1 TaxID=3383027 RepID=UPI003FF06A1C
MKQKKLQTKPIYFLLFILFATTSKLCAQQQDSVPSVEKSIFNIQIGLVGSWVNYEGRLSNPFTIRTEIGLTGAAWETPRYGDQFYSIAPNVTVEPRFYYNLGRRLKKGKNIKNNTGNFFSLKTSYSPNVFYISSF